MAHTEKWIWLPADRWLDRQSCAFSSGKSAAFAVADFACEYAFGCDVAEAQLRVSGDTEFRLYLNGEILCTGPANVDGDILFGGESRSKHYATELTVRPHEVYLHR